MFKTIVWATDGSDDAERALSLALELARESDGTLLVVHADERLGGRAGNIPTLADERDIVTSLEAKVRELIDRGVRAEFIVKRGTAIDPGDLVAKVARERGADVIVVGTRGHGRLAGMLLGSVTQRLLHVSPCPVLAVPAQVRAAATVAV